MRTYNSDLRKHGLNYSLEITQDMVYNHFVEKIIFNEHNNIKIKNKVRLGVSICLDVISTPKKSQSQQSRFSRQFEKRHLDSRDFLNSLKNDISTNLDNFYAIKSRFVSIFIFISIETLDQDSFKKDISTDREILISTVETPRLNYFSSKKIFRF